MNSYVEEMKEALTAKWPSNQCMVFGHLGDGNLHVVVGVGDKGAKQAVEAVVYEGLKSRGGSISAEHGVGVQKKAYLSMTRTADEIEIMQRIKASLDPNGILNPGKIFGAV